MFLLNIKASLNERGFSFVELMVTIVIVGVALIPVFALFDFGLKTQVQSEQELIALNLAQSKLEELLTEYYEHEYKLLEAGSITTNTKIQGQSYRITSVVTAPYGGVQELSVVVTYEISGKEKNVELTTRVVEYR